MGDVLKFEAGDSPEQESRVLDIQEIQNYRTTLQKAERELAKKPFGLNLLRDLHANLMDSVRGRTRAPGEFRRTQNWVGPPGSTIETAAYVPPSPDRLMGYLDNWERYYHADQPDPLVQLALLNAQFELIHPFLDGNGRLGRLIIPLYLHEKQLLSRPMFYLSDWLERHRDAYYDHLQALSVRTGAWNDWIVFFLQGVEEQALANVKTASSILALYEKLKVRIIEVSHSQWSVPLLDAMFRRPVFTSSTLNLKRPSPTRPSLANLLRALRADGILKVVAEGSGRRATVYVLAELVNLSEGRKVF